MGYKRLIVIFVALLALSAIVTVNAQDSRGPTRPYDGYCEDFPHVVFCSPVSPVQLPENNIYLPLVINQAEP